MAREYYRPGPMISFFFEFADMVQHDRARRLEKRLGAYVAEDYGAGSGLYNHYLMGGPGSAGERHYVVVLPDDRLLVNPENTLVAAGTRGYYSAPLSDYMNHISSVHRGRMTTDLVLAREGTRARTVIESYVTQAIQHGELPPADYAEIVETHTEELIRFLQNGQAYGSYDMIAGTVYGVPHSFRKQVLGDAIASVLA